MTTTSDIPARIEVGPLRRWLQINVCVLCCLAAIIFAAAEGSPLGLITVPIAVIGLLMVDRRGEFGISALWANVLGFVAFVAAGAEFFGSIEGRLLGFAHLLVYLTWILLLQRKGKAQFWWLCALSVLQVATASVLTYDVWFPLAAIAYMMLALWTLSVFSIDRAVTRSSGVQSARPTRGRPESEADPSRSRSHVQSESASQWLSGRFVTGVLINGGLSLLLALAIFVLTPRISMGFRTGDDSPTAANQPLTGFAEEVSLGDMGEILENPNLVLEVVFFDHQTDEPLDVEATMSKLGYNTPLFRGKVMGRYRNGRWSRPLLATTFTIRRNDVPPDGPLLRQEITLHPIGTRTLFAADRAVACRARGRVRIEQEMLGDTFQVRTGRAPRDRFEYEAFSLLKDDPVPNRNWRADLTKLRMDGRYQQSMLPVPRNLVRLEELTQRLLRTEQGADLTQAQIASTLLDHLRNSGRYGYTLNVSVDDPTIDPVEDFLFNRRQGHCEYFASALALMLRTAGVPSRLVSGFKGGALNEKTGRFEVRQLHAHAWVEAKIDGEWIVLDPTPAARDESVAAIDTSTSSLQQIQQSMQLWWSRALQLNPTQQKNVIYEPLRELASEWVDSVRRVGVLQSLAGWLKQLRTNPEEWISVRGFVTAFVLLSLCAGLVWVMRRCWNLLRSISRDGRRRQRQQRKVVAFYERFRSLVARKGYVRNGHTTQREFATQIENDWHGRPDVDGLARLPTDLTDAFYRVRFGHVPLPDQELHRLESSLNQLEAWVRRSNQ